MVHPTQAHILKITLHLPCCCHTISPYNMLMKSKYLLILIIALLATLPITHQAHAEDVEETTDSAIWLIQKTKLIHARGAHNTLRRSLRQLEDKDLKPLFSDMVQSKSPLLQVHGILGISELSKPPKLDLALLANIKDKSTQSSIVSAALATDLLTLDQCKQILAWKEPDTGLLAIVCAKLLSENQLPSDEPLLTLDKSENLLHRSLAHIMLLQRNNPKGLAGLNELDKSEDPNRDLIKLRILQFASQWKFDKSGKYAMSVLNDKDTPIGLARTALRVAIKFNAPGSLSKWQQLFNNEKSEPARIRLAIHLLKVAPHVEPVAFTAIAKSKTSQQSLMTNLSKLGQAVANKQPVDEPFTALYKLNQEIITQTLLDLTFDLPEEQTLTLHTILVRDLDNTEQPLKNRIQRLSAAVVSTQKLMEKHKQGPEIVKRLFQTTKDESKSAILMGLINVSAEFNPNRIIEDYSDWPDNTTKYLATLIRAKNTEKLSPEDIDTLSLIIRGGTSLKDELRVQAAWVYLKHKGKHQLALAKVIGR